MSMVDPSVEPEGLPLPDCPCCGGRANWRLMPSFPILIGVLAVSSVGLYFV